MTIGWMNGVMTVLLEIVEVNAAVVDGVDVVVDVVVQVVEFVGVEVLVVVVAVEVEVEEPQEVDTAAVEC